MLKTHPKIRSLFYLVGFLKLWVYKFDHTGLSTSNMSKTMQCEILKILSFAIWCVKVWELIFGVIFFSCYRMLTRKLEGLTSSHSKFSLVFTARVFMIIIKIYTNNCPWLCLIVKQDGKNIFKNKLFICMQTTCPEFVKNLLLLPYAHARAVPKY